MVSNKFLLFLVLLSIFNLNVIYADEILNISKKELIRKKWKSDNIENIRINFFEDNKYIIFSFEGFDLSHGEFLILNNNLILESSDRKDFNKDFINKFYNKKGTKTFVLRKMNISPYYSVGLISDNGELFWDIMSEPEIGQDIYINGFKSYKIQSAKIIIEEPIEMKKKPELKSDNYLFQMNCDPPEINEYINKIPKGTIINTLVEHIDNKGNMWYYIDIKFDCISQYAILKNDKNSYFPDIVRGWINSNDLSKNK